MALTVNSITVNPGSTYAVFTLGGDAGQLVNLSLSGGTAAPADYGPTLQVSDDDGISWTDDNGNNAVLNAGGALLVRTSINQVDVVLIDEDFGLSVSITNGESTTGLATILALSDLSALSTDQVSALTTDQVQSLTTNQLNSLITAQYGALRAAQVAALTTNQLISLETADLTALSAAQVQAIALEGVAALTTAQLNAMGTAQIAALTTGQIQAIESSHLAALGTTNLTALSLADVAALTTSQLNALTTGVQVPSLKTAQVAALTTAQIQGLSTTALNALTTGQFRALTAAQIAALTTDQASSLETTDLAALTTAQVRSITATDFAVLTTAQLNAMGTAQIAALTKAQTQAIESSHLAALGTTNLTALSLADVAALTTSQLNALTTAQYRALTTAQVRAITTTNIAAMSSNGLCALTSTQIQALTAQQIRAIATGHITPLVLDLNDHGPLTLSIAAGVQFDVGNTGQVAATGWVAPGNGLLVLDRNANGRIDDGGELFGSGTLMPDGRHAADGFAALATLDANHDGLIDSRDSSFDALAVWVDANSDGVTQSSELKGLDALSITGLHLDAERTIAFDNGNLIGLMGRYDSADGSTQVLADVWLATDATVAPAPVSLRTVVSDLTESLGRFTEQLDGFQPIAGPVLNLPTASSAAPTELSRSLAAQLSAFIDQNSMPMAALVGVAPAVGLLSPDLTLAPATAVNAWMAPLTAKRPDK